MSEPSLRDLYRLPLPSATGRGAGAPAYLPSGYKQSTHTTTEGIARTGQRSKEGTVSHTEHWSGRLDAHVRPRTVVKKLFKE